MAIVKFRFLSFLLQEENFLLKQFLFEAWEYIPRVWEEDRKGFEESAAMELDIPGYVFTESTEDGVVPRTTQPYYFPVYYVDPLEPNRLGFISFLIDMCVFVAVLGQGWREKENWRW